MSLGKRHLAPLRCLLVWLAAGAAALSTVAWCRADLGHGWAAVRAGDLAAQPFEQVLVWLCALALTACAVWLWVVTTMVAGAAAVGWTPRRMPGSPAWLRRAVLGACGVALAGSLAAPSYAATTQSHHAHDRQHVSVIDYLVGLSLPDRTTAGSLPRHATPTSATTPTAPAPASAPTVVVRPGDTLWGLAAADLPSGAPPAAVAHRWQQIYAANRAVVGADPDVIHPGQRLRLP
ncbi:MAG: LysM peptidoglycan-binding domain-containing protein [Nocardioides sp.]